jgi:hypothetical protein
MNQRALLFSGLFIVGACDWSPTRLKDGYCEELDDCKAGQICQLSDQSAPTWHMCICTGLGCMDGGVDVSTTIDGPKLIPDVGALVDEGTVDKPIEIDMGSIDTGIDVNAIDVGIDTVVVDAVESCGIDSDCPDPNKSFCVANVCTGCQMATADACATRSTAKPVCASTGTFAGQCVECTRDTQCTKNPAKVFCVANACTGCNTAGATGCSTQLDGKTVCVSTGTAAGQCVECMADAQCTKEPAKAFCVANACTGCTTSGATGCTGKTDGKIVCASNGTATGQCVECTSDAHCTKEPAKGFCVANACTGCGTAGATGCTGRTDGKTVCATTGAVAGQCVVCVTSADCKVATAPICNASNQCTACKTDSECMAKLGANPGVCMSHLDGHCATDAESIYVGTMGTVACLETSAGTVQAPVCSVQSGVTKAKSSSKPLVVVTGSLTPSSTTIATASPLTIVGKNNAMLSPSAGADGITINSGEIYLRGLTVQGSASTSTGIGIKAEPSGGNAVTLHMDACKVTDNPGGGILLNDAVFDIKNTTISGNGPGTVGAITWGGILVNSIPDTGTASINQVTIRGNNPVGLSCAGSVQGTGVLVSGNTSSQITPSCGITACTTASTTCGAQ